MFVENVNFVLNWWIFFGKSVKMNSYNKKGYLDKSGVFVMDYPQVKDELVEFNKLVFLYNAAIKEMKLRLETLRDENASLRLAASQQAQNVYLVDKLNPNPCPKPAYVVQPPQTVSFPLGCNGIVNFSGGCGCQ